MCKPTTELENYRKWETPEHFLYTIDLHQDSYKSEESNKLHLVNRQRVKIT